jgi:hypothetical protein
MQEFSHDIFTEHVACAPLTKAEALHVSFRIRPHQVSEGTFMRNFFDALDLSVDITYVLQGW